MLFRKHRGFLEKSAISDSVAKARGYRSVDSESEFRRLGFTHLSGSILSVLRGMVIPSYDISGKIAWYQVKVDADLHSRTVKRYLESANDYPMFDVPPPMRHLVADQNTPLWLTEGVRKADALASLGIPCIDVLGTKRIPDLSSPEWARIPFRNRVIYVALDSDVEWKSPVGDAEKEIVNLLRLKDARPCIVRLPGRLKVDNAGLDDFIAAQGTLARAKLNGLADVARSGLTTRTCRHTSSSYRRNPHRDPARCPKCIAARMNAGGSDFLQEKVSSAYHAVAYEHSTNKRLVPSIKDTGLDPSHGGKTRGTSTSNSVGRVHITKDRDIAGSFGRAFHSGHEASLQVIMPPDITSHDYKEDPIYPNTGTIQVTKTISPDYIRVRGENSAYVAWCNKVNEIRKKLPGNLRSLTDLEIGSLLQSGHDNGYNSDSDGDHDA